MSSRSLTTLVSIVFALSPLLARASGADPLDLWQWRNPLPTGNPIRDATFANSLFVAVGDDGTILTSPDGVDWTTRLSGVTNTLLGVGHANGTFVAVGQLGAVLTSTDGSQWVSRSSGVTQQLNQLVYANGQFVVVGNGGTVLTSADGTTWTPRNPGTNAPLRDIAFGNGLFVAMTGQNTALVSSDAETWSSKVVYTGVGSGQFSRIAFGNGRFAVAGAYFTGGFAGNHFGSVFQSVDGTNWSKSVESLGIPEPNVSIVRFLDGRFIATSTSGQGVFASVDTLNWSTNVTGVTNVPTFNLAYGAGRYLMTGSSFAFVSSTNLLDWTPNRPSVRGTITGVATGNGRHVAVGGLEKFGIPNVTYQSDTILLNAVVGGEFGGPGYAASFSAVHFAGNAFIAVGNNGTVLRSLNGLNWSGRASATFQRLFGLTYADGKFVAVGENGAIITSPDGLVWTYRQSGTQYPLYGVGYGPAGFVAVGYFGTLLRSPDGITWTAENAGTLRTLFGVASDGERYIAVGEAGAIIASANATSWTTRPSPTTQNLFSVAFGAGYYVAVGAPGLVFSPGTGNVLLTSTNGSDWVARFPGTSARLLGVSFTGSSFLVVGAGGTVLESGSLSQMQVAGRFLPDMPAFQVILSGQSSQPCRLQAAGDLHNDSWVDIASFPQGTTPKLFTDTNVALWPRRFYRVVSP